ncbi:MAG: hypothetical protein R3C70_17700 [Geminicoccaceae bacterium]
MPVSLLATRLAALLPPGSLFLVRFRPDGVALELHTDDGAAIHLLRDDGRLVIERDADGRAFVETVDRAPVLLPEPTG